MTSGQARPVVDVMENYHTRVDGLEGSRDVLYGT